LAPYVYASLATVTIGRTDEGTNSSWLRRGRRGPHRIGVGRVSINLQKIVSDPSSGLPCGGSSRAAAAEELGTMRPDLRGAFVLRVALGQVAALPLVIAGVPVLAGGPGGLYWLVPGTVFPILVALFAAWVLLVEINR
jgi:hypothetical protein